MAAWALGGIKGSFKVSGWKYFRIFAAALLQEKWNEQRLYRGGRQPEQRGGRAAVATLARYLLASSRGYYVDIYCGYWISSSRCICTDTDRTLRTRPYYTALVQLVHLQ